MFGVLKPETGGDDFVLEKTELILGRSKECDLTLGFSDVSSRHCRLVLQKGYWYVVDLRSTNGTKLNGMKVTDFRVDPGGKLTFGTHVYTLEYDPLRNGNDGVVPADCYESNPFSKSLLESAGLAPASVRTSTRMPHHDVADDGSNDYSGLTVDDLKFDRDD